MTFAQQVCDALNTKTNANVTVIDYQNWLEPENMQNYDAFDNAVLIALGDELYEYGDSVARLHDQMLYTLGLGGNESGGITLL